MIRNILFKTVNPIFLGLSFLLLFSAPLYAEEQDRVSYQGVINSLDLSNGFMVVNEKTVLLTPETLYLNHKEHKVLPSDWTAGKWVYVVGHSSSRGQVADKLYLLPGRMKSKDVHLYPFTSADEGDDSGQ